MRENLNIQLLIETTDEKEWKNIYESEILKLDKLYQEEERLIHEYYTSGKRSPRLEEIAQTKHNIMTNDKLISTLSRWEKKLPDLTWKKRIHVLLNYLKQEVDENNPSIVEKKENLKKSLIQETFVIDDTTYDIGLTQATLMESANRDLRQKLFKASNKVNKSIEEEFRSLIQARNQLANQHGYSNYYEYRFSLLDINLKDFLNQINQLIKTLKDLTDKWNKRIKTEYGWADLHFFDVNFAALNFSHLDSSLFPVNKLEDALNDMMESIALKPEQLPIEISLHSLPFGGYCSPVSPNELYVVINKVNSFIAFLTGFHETGHAIDNYFADYKYSEFYRFKSIISAECISELFQTVATDPEFLKRNFNVDNDVILQVKEMESLTNLIVLKTSIYLSLLEHEIYANPNADLQEISNQLAKDIFDVQGEGVNPYKQFLYVDSPTYMQDYIFALAFREMVRSSFKIQSLYGETEVFEKVKNEFIIPAEGKAWKEKAESLCGEKFTFKYLADRFKY